MAISVDRIHGVAGGLAIKAPVRVATTADITLSGLQTIDGVVLVDQDRVLVKNQTAAADNGIWVATTSSWSRALDFNGALDVVQGTFVRVTSGTANQRTMWELTTTSPVVGTSSLTFALANDVDLVASLAGTGAGQGADLVANAVRRVATVTDLKALTEPSAGKTVELENYTSGVYGGGGPIYWDSASTATANDGTVFAINSAPATGRFRRFHKAVWTFREFGCRCDGSTNDYTRAAAAIAELNSGAITGLHLDGPMVIDGTLTVTRDGVSITTVHPRLTRFIQAGNNDTLVLTPTSPTTDTLTDILLQNIGIDVSVAAPTAGRALSITRGSRIQCPNMDIRNVYQGIDIEGGNEIFFPTLSVHSSAGWSSVQVGTYLFKTRKYAGGVNEIPSEIYVSDFNIKGATYAASAHKLEKAILIQCVDGLFLSNGHAGFADLNSMHINPQADATASLLNVECSNVYLDGSNGGSTSGAGLEITGSAGATVAHVHFNGGAIKNHKGKGVYSTFAITDLDIASEINNNGKQGADITNAIDLDLDDSEITDNNRNNVSANAVDLASITKGSVIGAKVISAATFAHPVGVAIGAGCSGLTVTDNTMGGHATDFTCGSTQGIKLAHNTNVAGLPSVASADGFTLPLGYDTVTITGTANMSNISATNIPGYEFTLLFTSTASVNDGAGNVKLTGAFNATTDSTLTLMNTGSGFTEKARAVV